MLDSIRGVVLEAGLDSVVLECGGFAMRVRTPPHSTPGLKKGGEARFYCHLLFRDEQFHLYGFIAAQERNLFNVLLGVSGLGPEKARALLGALSPGDVVRAVAEGDSRRFQAVKGIGTRLAQRLALELKGKLDAFAHAFASGAPPRGGMSGESAVDLITALSQLGYPRGTAEAATEDALKENPDASMEELVKFALRSIQQKRT